MGDRGLTTRFEEAQSHSDTRVDQRGCRRTIRQHSETTYPSTGRRTSHSRIEVELEQIRVVLSEQGVQSIRIASCVFELVVNFGRDVGRGVGVECARARKDGRVRVVPSVCELEHGSHDGDEGDGAHDVGRE